MNKDDLYNGGPLNVVTREVAPPGLEGVNNVKLDLLEPTHTPRRARSLVWLFKSGGY